MHKNVFKFHATALVKHFCQKESLSKEAETSRQLNPLAHYSGVGESVSNQFSQFEQCLLNNNNNNNDNNNNN